MSLQSLNNTRGLADMPRYIFWDNDSSSSESLSTEVYDNFGVIMVYNVPNNPSGNAVENYFGVVKGIFRHSTPTNRYLKASDIMASIRRSIKTCYQSMIASAQKICLNNLNSILLS